MLEGLNVRRYIVRDGPAGWPCIVLVVLAVQCLEIDRDAPVELLEEFCELVLRAVTVFSVDRLEFAAINGPEFPREDGPPAYLTT